jgi:nucleoid DNA-binding protein
VIRRVFAAQIAKVTGHPAATVESILEAAITALATQLAQAGRFEWRGLGTFSIRNHAARRIHNPSTNQTIVLSPRKTVAFKPSLKLKIKLGASRNLRSRK